MYAKKLSVYDFRCFGKAVLELQYPGRATQGASEFANVNLILGDNGGGKSSILRAIAIAILAPILLESGFVANYVVRRPGGKNCLVKVNGLLEGEERISSLRGTRTKRTQVEMLARFDSRALGYRDRLHLDSTPATPIERIFDEYSPQFFMVGYGATRRVETGDYSESSARKTRGIRYNRVAGLFEDHVAVRPLNSWLSRLHETQRVKALEMLTAVLPPNVRFLDRYDKASDQVMFEFNERPTPFSSLSDGYKAFIGMAGDLIGHLSDICPESDALNQIPGIVLIDEIDLHLHPAWQRTILSSLSQAFPRLQFVCTTHSPLVASTVRKENVFVTGDAEDGTATIKQIEERVYGRSAEQLLLSSYFGLQSTRPDSFQDESEALFQKAATGNRNAALSYLKKLAEPIISLQKRPRVAAKATRAKKSPSKIKAKQSK